MKLKVKDPILDYNGKAIQENEIKITQQHVNDFKQLLASGQTNGKQIVDALEKEVQKDVLTFRTVIHNALNTLAQENDRPEILSSTDKAKCYEISLKLFSYDEPDFTEDQVEFILKRIEKIYLVPIICGRVKDALTKK